jgi:hypothetical protein
MTKTYFGGAGTDDVTVAKMLDLSKMINPRACA